MKNTILTIGMFDGVHLGHRKILNLLLEKSKSLSLQPVVVTFDRHPRQVLANEFVFKLLNTFDERISILESTGVDVCVIPFSMELSQLSACRFFDTVLRPKFHPEAFVFGYDNTFGNRADNDFPLLRSRLKSDGVRCFDVDPLTIADIEVSSTRIRRALDAGNVDAANAMLGYHYSIDGKVVEGRQIGRTLGFPTANIEIDSASKMLPSDGVYVVSTMVQGDRLMGVANLGTQPTVAGSRRMLEVHLLHFNGVLYGQPLSISFHARIRDIRQFESRQALSDQISCDVAFAESMNL